MKNYLLLIGLIITSSCSVFTKKGPIAQKVYKESTSKAFESLEHENSQAIDFYKELRKRDWENYRYRPKRGSHQSIDYRQTPIRVYSRSRSPKKKYIPQNYNKPQKQVLKKKEALKIDIVKQAPKRMTEVISEEIGIELSQYSNYFCMRNRKNGRFNDLADCQAYTESINHKCQKQHGLNSSFKKCVRKKLSIR